MTIKEIVKYLEENKPYPSDVSTEPTDEEWKSVVPLLMANRIVPDRIFAKWGRMVWNNCVNQMKELIEEEGSKLEIKRGVK